MLDLCSLTRSHIFHIRRKLRRHLGRLRDVIEQRQISAKRDVDRRLIFLFCHAPFLRRFDHFRGRGHGELRHEEGPIQEGRIGDEEGGDGVVGQLASFGLAEEIAGHGHAGNAAQLDFRHAGYARDFKVGDGAIQGDASEDVEVAEPADGREMLVLGEWSVYRGFVWKIGHGFF